MSYRSLHFMSRKAEIWRANYVVDVTTIRDRVLTGYTTVKAEVPIYIEPTGTDFVGNTQLGNIGVDSFTAYVPAGSPVLVNDILKSDGEYFEVRGVSDFSKYGWQIRVDCVRKNFQRS